MRILLIEDDTVLIDVLVKSLTEQRYVVDVANDGLLGWDYAESASYDLILMDVGLPKLNGVELCQRLRTQGCSTPILLMTAKDASTERIRGLDAGADDYLTKPLDLGELQARVRALLRRGEGSHIPTLAIAGLQLDPSSCSVTYQGRPLVLTPKEYSLLELFLRNPSRVFSRANIIEHLWSFDDPPQEESVKAHIKGLRQKLKAAGAVDWIENVYGLGYRLNPQETEAIAPNSPNLEAVAGSRPSQLAPSGASGSTSSPITVNPSAVAIAPQPTLEQQYSQSLAQLWKQHQSVMTERLSVLQQVAMSVQIGSLPQPLRQSAQQAAHKLAGVLGMFEREAGTRIAHELEELLEGDKPLSTSQKKTLRSRVQALAEAMQLSPTEEALSTVAPASVQNTTLLSRPQSKPPELSPPQSLMNLLVVDDDPVFTATLPPILEPWGIHAIALNNPLDLWQVLPVAAPDLLVLDVEMPPLSGIELCKAVRAHADWQALPILFLTAHREPEMIQQMFAAGADDYITKPIVGPELLTRITNRLERIRLLQTLSRRDPLTGLLNQPHSVRELEQAIQSAKANRHPMCLCILEAVELQQIIVQAGHSVGNLVVQQWGRLLQSSFQGGEVLGYWGKGEFVVGMPDVTATEAGDRLSELLALLRQQIFTTPDGDRFQVTSKVSMAEYPKHGESLRSLYQFANQPGVGSGLQIE